MATLGNLPQDLLIEILSMLPVESLLRFKSICKFWYALINHPTFVRKHLSNSTQHGHVLLKHCVTLECSKPQYTFSIFSFNQFESFFNVHLPLDEDLMDFNIHSHSHGLLCLSDTDMCRIFLCNPITMELRELPQSILLLTKDGYTLEPHAVGFGYDPKSKDFKVVKVVDFFSSRYINYSRVEIYDLSKDRWREIECPVWDNNDFPYWTPHHETYSEGTYYWWVDVYESYEMIITFDLKEEVFDRISIPAEIKEQHTKSRNLGVLNESIILHNYNNYTIDVWKMNKDEYEVFSWSRLLTINDPIFIIQDLLFFVSSHELLIEVKQGRVILYNIKTQDFKFLPIKGNPLDLEATFFVKSLVSVKGGINRV